MTIATEIRRPLGTMIVYGYPRGDLAVDLAIAATPRGRCRRDPPALAELTPTPSPPP